MNKVLYRWFPVVAWMAIIFFFSTRQRLQASSILTVNFIFFKSLHVIEYGILYFLLFRALYNSMSTKDLRKVFITAFILSIAYSASDEFHQTLVPSREGTIRDMCIDTVGMTIMYLFIKSNLSNLKKFLQ